jgi:hypothetical protein
MGCVVVQRQRARDAHASKCQALLPSQVRQRFDVAERQGMCSTAQEMGFEQRGNILKAHRPIGQSFSLHFDFNQRFKPKQAARAVALQIQRQASGVGFFEQRIGHFICTHSQSG